MSTNEQLTTNLTIYCRFLSEKHYRKCRIKNAEPIYAADLTEKIYQVFRLKKEEQILKVLHDDGNSLSSYAYVKQGDRFLIRRTANHFPNGKEDYICLNCRQVGSHLLRDCPKARMIRASGIPKPMLQDMDPIRQIVDPSSQKKRPAVMVDDTGKRVRWMN